MATSADHKTTNTTNNEDVLEQNHSIVCADGYKLQCRAFIPNKSDQVSMNAFIMVSKYSY